MRTQDWPLLMVFASTMPVLGCSLMGLDDFGGAPCQTDADCSKTKPLLQPGASACGAAVCEKQKGLCEWQEGHEICNGKDDDCDGLIDEGPIFSASTNPIPAGSAVPNAVAYASNLESAQTFVAVAVDGGASEGFSLGPDSAGLPRELQYASALGMGCPKMEKDPASDATVSCNFAELALAADARHLVFASINTVGCDSGQVRVGLSGLDDPFTVWLGKPKGAQTEDPGNVAFGVDVQATTGCTGPGATRPAVASLGTEAGGEGALLLWLAAANTGLATASLTTNVPDSIPVEALGLVVPAEEPIWLDGTDQGKPIELGPSTSLSAPAVLALKSSSGRGKYLVAFPAEQDGALGIQLVSVHVSTSTLGFEPLDFLGVGAADQVSLALGKTDGTELGLAWRSGDGADAQLCFTTVSSSGRWPTPQTISKFKTPEPTTTAQILYRDAGFAIDEPSGGWFLSWVDATGSDTPVSQLARIRDETLEILTQRSLQSDPLARALLYPSSSNDASSVGYALIRPAVSGTTTLETIPDWCK